jgi:hypothetical protein
MTDKFQINGRHQFKSIKEGLILISLGPIGLLIGILSGKFGMEDLPLMLTVFGLYYLVLFSPAFYLHTTYFLDNWDTQLTVDMEEIKILNKRDEFKYRQEDIEKAELNLGIYYKNRIDNMGRWTTPWTNYGYLKLKFKDGKEFYFTSLMIDLDKLPFPVTSTRFRFTPYIDKNQIQYKNIKAHNNRIQQDKIAEYQERFSNLADDKLLEKINNPTRFEFEARKAARNILQQREKLLPPTQAVSHAGKVDI